MNTTAAEKLAELPKNCRLVSLAEAKIIMKNAYCYNVVDGVIKVFRTHKPTLVLGSDYLIIGGHAAPLDLEYFLIIKKADVQPLLDSLK